MSIRYTEVAEDGEVMLERSHVEFSDLLDWRASPCRDSWFDFASSRTNKRVKFIIFDSQEE